MTEPKFMPQPENIAGGGLRGLASQGDGTNPNVESSKAADGSSRGNKSLKIAVIVLAVLLVAAVVAIAVFAVGIATSRIAVTMKQPGDKVAVVEDPVCGQDMIKKFNSITDTSSQSMDAVSANEKSTTDLVSDIKDKDYNSDPTCTYMLIQLGFRIGDIELTKQAYSQTNKLIDSGKNIDSHVNNIMSRDTLRQTMSYYLEK